MTLCVLKGRNPNRPSMFLPHYRPNVFGQIRTHYRPNGNNTSETEKLETGLRTSPQQVCSRSWPPVSPWGPQRECAVWFSPADVGTRPAGAYVGGGKRGSLRRGRRRRGPRRESQEQPPCGPHTRPRRQQHRRRRTVLERHRRRRVVVSCGVEKLRESITAARKTRIFLP